MTNEHPPIDPVALLQVPGNPHRAGSGGAVVFALLPAGVAVGYALPAAQVAAARRLVAPPPRPQSPGAA